MTESPRDPFADYPEVVRAIEEAPPPRETGDGELPPALLESLERIRREALASRAREGGEDREEEAGSAPAAAAPVRPFPRRAALGWCLAAAAAVAVAAVWLKGPPGVEEPAAPAMARVVVTSPGDRIEATRPVISWTSRDEPGQRYDVWILPEDGDYLEAPALFAAESVTSPVAFDQLEPGPEAPADGALEPGTGYRVLVCLADAGRMSGRPVPFRVE